VFGRGVVLFVDDAVGCGTWSSASVAYPFAEQAVRAMFHVIKTNRRQRKRRWSVWLRAIGKLPVVVVDGYAYRYRSSPAIARWGALHQLLFRRISQYRRLSRIAKCIRFLLLRSLLLLPANDNIRVQAQFCLRLLFLLGSNRGVGRGFIPVDITELQLSASGDVA